MTYQFLERAVNVQNLDVFISGIWIRTRIRILQDKNLDIWLLFGILNPGDMSVRNSPRVDGEQ